MGFETMLITLCYRTVISGRETFYGLCPTSISKFHPKIDVIFDTVFRSIFDRFPEPSNLENVDFSL